MQIVKICLTTKPTETPFLCFQSGHHLTLSSLDFHICDISRRQKSISVETLIQITEKIKAVYLPLAEIKEITNSPSNRIESLADDNYAAIFYPHRGMLIKFKSLKRQFFLLGKNFLLIFPALP